MTSSVTSELGRQEPAHQLNTRLTTTRLEPHGSEGVQEAAKVLVRGFQEDLNFIALHPDPARRAPQERPA